MPVTLEQILDNQPKARQLGEPYFHHYSEFVPQEGVSGEPAVIVMISSRLVKNLNGEKTWHDELEVEPDNLKRHIDEVYNPKDISHVLGRLGVRDDPFTLKIFGQATGGFEFSLSGNSKRITLPIPGGVMTENEYASDPFHRRITQIAGIQLGKSIPRRMIRFGSYSLLVGSAGEYIMTDDLKSALVGTAAYLIGAAGVGFEKSDRNIRVERAVYEALLQGSDENSATKIRGEGSSTINPLT